MYLGAYPPQHSPKSTGRNKNQQVIIVFFLLCLVLERGGFHSAFSMQEVLHWMQHQGAGPDPRVNSADEVKQKAERGSPALRGLQGGMLLTLQTKRARPQSSPIPSLIRKKDSLGAPSPTRRSICTQAKLNWYIFPHYSRRPLLRVPPSRRPSKGRRETERHWG